MIYQVSTGLGRPILQCADAVVLQAVLNLHRDALVRIKAETENGGVCELHNDRGMFLGTYKKVNVTKIG